MDERCETAKRPNPRAFDAYTDWNGQNFWRDEAYDVGRPDSLQHTLLSDPGWPAETARIASDFPHLDAISGGSVASVGDVEVATPTENLRHISGQSPAAAAPASLRKAPP